MPGYSHTLVYSFILPHLKLMCFFTFFLGDTLGLTANSESDLGVSCLGAIIWYLKLCKLEQDLLTRKLFDVYIPPDDDAIVKEVSNNEFRNKHMVCYGYLVLKIFFCWNQPLFLIN